MSQLAKDFLKKIDQFGYSQTLNINGESSYKTVVGGFLTISVFFLYGIATVYFGQEIWKMREPVVVTSSKEYDIMPDIIIGKHDFSIYMNIATKYYVSYIDTSIFTVTAKLYEYENGTLVDTPVMEVNACSQYYGDSSEISNKTTVDINNYYCIKPDEYKLKGFWGNKRVSQAHIFFNKCVNTTENTNSPCKSNEEIDDILKDGVIGFYATNYIKRINEVENPIVSFLQDNFHILNLANPLTCIINLRQLTFVSDSGFLLEDTSTIIKPYFDSVFWQTGSKQESLFAHIHLIGFSLGETVLRKYSKIQDISMKIGGIGSFIKFTAYLIGIHFSKVKYKVDLLFNVLYRQSGNNNYKTKPYFLNQNYIKNNELLTSSMNLLTNKKIKNHNSKNSHSSFNNDLSMCNINEVNINKSSFKNETSTNKLAEERELSTTKNNKFVESKVQAVTKSSNIKKIGNYLKQTNINNSSRNSEKQVENADNVKANAHKVSLDNNNNFDRASIEETNFYYKFCDNLKDIICYSCLTAKCNKLHKNRVQNVLDKYNHCLSIDIILEKTLMIEALCKSVFKENEIALVEKLGQNMLKNMIEVPTKNFNSHEVFIMNKII